jgi:hypothetical protein
VQAKHTSQHLDLLSKFAKELAKSKEHSTDMKNLKLEQAKIMGKYIHLLKKHNADSSAITTM